MDTPVSEPEVLLLVDQHTLDLAQGVELGLQLLVVATDASALQLVQIFLQFLLILQTQLLRNDLAVPDGVDFALHMGNVIIIEGA